MANILSKLTDKAENIFQPYLFLRALFYYFCNERRFL